MLAIVAVLMIGNGFYACDWQERYQRRDSAQVRFSERSQQWQGLQSAIEEYPRVQREVQTRKRQLSQVMASRSGPERADDFVPNYLGEVERRVNAQKDHNLRILSITPSPGTQSETRVFTLSMRGSYATTVNFLYELSALKAERVLTINSVRLSPGPDSQLNVELPVTAYLRR